MSKLAVLSTLLLGACIVGSDPPAGGNGDGNGNGNGNGDGDGDGDGDGSSSACSLPETGGDAGDLTALVAQQCNVPGSGGAQKWYRLSATLAGSMDVVQVDLWDGRGAFTGGAVAIGSYPITGAELDPATCGVCLRGLGDKGAATQKEYFGTGGTVEITAIGGDGQPISATITNGAFAEVDATTRAPVSGGCTAAMTRAKVSGTVLASGGGGGGGGGGCPAGVGD